MQHCEGAFDIFHDLGFGLHGVGASFGDLVGSGSFVEDICGHAVIVGGQVLDLLGESAYACKLACGWRKRILLRGHGIGGGNDQIFRVGNPEVERLADRANRRQLAVLRARRAAAGQQEQERQKTTERFRIHIQSPWSAGFRDRRPSLKPYNFKSALSQAIFSLVNIASRSCHETSARMARRDRQQIARDWAFRDGRRGRTSMSPYTKAVL